MKCVPSHPEKQKIRNMEHFFTFWNFIRRHKYAVAIVIFLFIIGLFDENSLYSRYQRRVEIGNLKREID